MVGMHPVLVIRLARLETDRGGMEAHPGDRTMEFHVSRRAREELGIESSLFRSTGNVIIPDFAAARALARRINERVDAALLPERAVRAGKINAMALIDEVLHDVARLYREGPAPEAFSVVLEALERELGTIELDRFLLAFVEDYPPLEVWKGEGSAKAWLEAAPGGVPNRLLAVEELFMLRLANENPAFAPCRFLFDDGSRAEGEGAAAGSLASREYYADAMDIVDRAFATLPRFGPDDEDLATMLRAPMRASPYSLPGQLDFIRKKWGLVLGERLLRLLGALDLIREEEKPRFPGPGPTRAYVYRGMEVESERFSPDKDWMPNVVMMAKSTLVWLHQLSVTYGREIRGLDAIPDEELDRLALSGFNALWLIGLWERSAASAEIKRRCGNPEAAASAYALHDYEIAGELGGWEALDRLRGRCSWRGIRLAADMVPNHTGIDSEWVRNRPEVFMSRQDCPYPGYSFNGPDLSGDGRVGIWLEDHYWDRTDAAVVFKRLDRATGRVDYIYHGNDGTGLPWSDTAQIDFLKGAAREAVKERILHVAKNFPIIRFDAAMVLAKRSFRRLWYPEPGAGGDVPSRAESALPQEAFDAAFPEEFWREVVDMCAREAPDTLLLAEAFWMMEGYFVRTLGMHRVYNSAFMNMLKREENGKYRETIRNTQEFDKDILKRFVNFMNNPDEDTAVAQFGKGDKYMGVCTMMATMPGLPMFGHGQLEGFEEKYGMEYRRAYRDETPDAGLMARHEREIFPLLKRRHLFSGVDQFLLYDLVQADGSVNENVFAYSNGSGGEKAVVVYNNAFARTGGHIRESCPFAEKSGGGKRVTRRSLAEALGLHAERGRFLVMREDRSGLWFIRRSEELAARGLELCLDGYQSQVFLDLAEVEDDARGLYAALCDTLGGRGVPDLGEALEDTALKDLYESLAAFVGHGLFAETRALLADGMTAVARRRKLAALLEDIAVPAESFYAGVECLLAEEGAEEGARADGKARAAAARLAAGLEAIAETAVLAASKREGPGREAAAFVLAKLLSPGGVELALAYLVMDALKGFVPEKPEAGAEPRAAASVAQRVKGGAARAGVLPEKAPGAEAGEAARRVAERVFLERKLREALRAYGIPGDAAHRGLSLVSAYLGKSGAFGGAIASGAKTRRDLALVAAAIACDFQRDEELRSRIGVNVFDGVEWFNKEAFEEALDLGVAVLALPAPQPARARQAKPAAPEPSDAAIRPAAAAKSARDALSRRLVATAGMATLFLEAEAASGFRLDALAKFIEAEAAPPAKKGRG